MNEPTKDLNWDWVTARHNAEPEVAFNRIREAVKANVESRNSQLAGTASRWTLEFAATESLFSVSSRGRLRNPAVSFSLFGGTIAVEFNAPALGNSFTINPILTPSGQNKVEIAGEQEPIEEWQLLRLALERVLFPQVPS